MKRIGAPLCLCMLFSLSYLSAGELSDTQKNESAHLLKTLSQSGCTFIRNGSAHTPEEAVGHIRKKHVYFQDDIDTTEEFIEYSATRSTLSGELYMIHCPGMEPIESRKWLLLELEGHRRRMIHQKDP